MKAVAPPRTWVEKMQDFQQFVAKRGHRYSWIMRGTRLQPIGPVIVKITVANDNGLATGENPE